MKAITYSEYGGPDVLNSKSAPRRFPTPVRHWSRWPRLA